MIYSNKEISIARLNAKIYTQRNKLIDYENIIKEQKKQIKVLKKQLKIAVEALKEIYVNTKGGRILCDFCHSAVECEGCVNQDVVQKTLNQIKE